MIINEHNHPDKIYNVKEVDILKIAVLYGGVSKERDVSISSSKGIMQALKKKWSRSNRN